MLDERVLIKKVRKKVWNTFNNMWDEVDFLEQLKKTQPDRYSSFLDNEFTREEGMRIEVWLRDR